MKNNKKATNNKDDKKDYRKP